MSRDQKPGRANLVGNSAQRSVAAPTVAAKAAPTTPGDADIGAKLPVRLLALVFVVASAASGIGISVYQGLRP